MVCGDFNYAGPINNVFTGLGGAPFSGWTDMRNVITNGGGRVLSNGIDHILSSANANEALAANLNFKSDAYHYPLAVTA